MSQQFSVHPDFAPFDRRTARIESTFSGGAVTSVTVERFVYDGTDVILDLKGTGATLSAAETALAVMTRYLWADHMRPGETSLLLAQENVTAAPVVAEVLWAFIDHQSTVRDLVRLNYSGGVYSLYASAHYQFDSFGKFFTGKENGVTITAPTFTRYTFTSQEYDSRLLTIDFGGRIYEPSSAKFTKNDPTGFPAGDFNLMRFMGNDPINRTDPTGFDWVDDKGGYIGWTVEDSSGWNLYHYELGQLDEYGMIHLTDSWGGGTISLADLNANAEANSIYGLSDGAESEVLRQRINSLKNGDKLVSDQPPTVCQGAAEGFRRGSVVVNDALTLYQFEGLHAEAERYIAQAQREGDTLTEYAFYSGRVGAHSAQAAVGLQVLSYAGVTQVGTVPLSAVPSTGYVELTIAVNTGTMFPATAAQGRNPGDVAVFATATNNKPPPLWTSPTYQDGLDLTDPHLASSMANRGPVVFNLPRAGATPAEVAQMRAYVDGCNEALMANALSPTGRVSTQGALEVASGVQRRLERARAIAAGTPYGTLQAGHVPDTTWTDNPVPHSWLGLTPRVNSSLGSQAGNYPLGYVPTGFYINE